MSVEVLYLDMATRAGYAAGGLRGVEAFGYFDIPQTNENIGRYLNYADRVIDKLVLRFQPAMLAFEAPWLNSKRDTIINLRKLSGLANVAEQVADRHEIECREATVHDVSVHFLGRGYRNTREAKKTSTRVKCRELGWEVETDDEADALAGLSYMLACKHPAEALAVTPMAKFLMAATQ